MRVSSFSSIGGGKVSPARKAQLEKQIQKLEKQKRRLQKKLRGESTSSGKSAIPSFENARVALGGGGEKTAVAMGSSPAAAPNVSAPGDGSATPAASIANAANTAPPAAMKVISAFSGLSQSASSGVEDMIEDPKEIMKQIMMLEQQIMILKQQLGEEPRLQPEDDDDNKPHAAFPIAGQGESAAVDSAAALPSPDVGADGHVDGYV